MHIIPSAQFFRNPTRHQGLLLCAHDKYRTVFLVPQHCDNITALCFKEQQVQRVAKIGRNCENNLFVALRTTPTKVNASWEKSNLRFATSNLPKLHLCPEHADYSGPQLGAKAIVPYITPKNSRGKGRKYK
eukprot:52099-Amphidinium_carterae.2